MSEHIRKYLTNQKCIIMLSVKVEQLIDAVQRNMQYIQQVDAKDSHEMAVKYVTKLIPVSSRVKCPCWRIIVIMSWNTFTRMMTAMIKLKNTIR